MSLSMFDRAIINACRDMHPEAVSDAEALDLAHSELYEEIQIKIRSGAPFASFELDLFRYNYLRSLYNETRKETFGALQKPISGN